MSCPFFSWCSNCCCKDEDDLDKGEEVNVKEKVKRKGSYTKLNGNDFEVIIPQFEKVPLDKVFAFKQPNVPMPIHPQISNTESFDYSTQRYPIHPEWRKPSLITEQQTSFIPVSDVSSPEPSDEPMLEFMVYYDFQKFTLTVTLLQATNLPAKDRSGTSDPYVTLFLLPHREDIHRSKTHYKTLNPIFDESFTFEGIQYSEVMERTLVLRVFDEDKISKNDNIGTIVMPLRKTELHGARVAAVLNEESSITQTTTNGDIQITLRYNPTMNVLSGVLIKATGLKRMDMIGLSDPYVEIKLYYKNEKEFSWKSTTRKKTLTPIYDEVFQIDLKDMDMDSIYIKLVMKDEDLVFKDDFMGMVEFGKHVEHSTGKKHWMDMLATPHTRITRWHTLVNKEDYTMSSMLRKL